MKAINSVQELVDEMAAAGDKLVILDFYAKWCNACRALFPKLCQLANDNPDIIVLKIDWDENKPICKALSVKVLPFFHFYRGALGRVAAFSASVSKVQRLRDALAEHNTPRCSLGEVPALAEFPNYMPGGGSVQRDQAEADVQAVVAAQRADLQANSAQPEPSQPQQPAADSVQWRAPQSQFKVAQLGGYGGNIVVSSPRSKAVKEREADAAAV